MYFQRYVYEGHIRVAIASLRQHSPKRNPSKHPTPIPEAQRIPIPGYEQPPNGTSKRPALGRFNGYPCPGARKFPGSRSARQ